MAGLIGPGGGGTGGFKIGKKAAEEIAEHGDDVAEEFIRIRHYTNRKGLNGIRNDGAIIARDQNKVFAESARRNPLSPRDVEAKYGIRPGHGRDFVETDIAASRVNRVRNPQTGNSELEIVGDVPLVRPSFQKRR